MIIHYGVDCVIEIHIMIIDKNGEDRLSKFNSEKLFVEFQDGVTVTGPITPRLYTLTHSDITGELFLTIGAHYAWDKINPTRDEVFAAWKLYGSSLYYGVYLTVDDGQFNLQESKKRKEIFRRELPLALTAIRYGDRFLFDQYPGLDNAPIIIHFMSTYPQLAKQEIWGTFYRYKK
jgi:hypothetical protein